MSIATVGTLASFVIFGLLGWAIGRRGSRPAGPLRLILLLVAAAAAGGLWGPRARLFDGFGLQMRFDHCFAACCLGGFVGLLVRNRRLRRPRGAEPSPATR